VSNFYLVLVWHCPIINVDISRAAELTRGSDARTSRTTRFLTNHIAPFSLAIRDSNYSTAENSPMKIDEMNFHWDQNHLSRTVTD